MKDKVRVVITNEQKKTKIPTGTKMLVRRCCLAVLAHEKFDGNAEVNVKFVDDEQIRKYNEEFRNIDKATDVLSFPLGQDGNYDVDPVTDSKMLGDIVISVQRAAEQADDYGHTFQREIAFLTVHSMLHLLGYDHVNGGIEAAKMREREELVLFEVGLPRSNTYTK